MFGAKFVCVCVCVYLIIFINEIHDQLNARLTQYSGKYTLHGMQLELHRTAVSLH